MSLLLEAMGQAKKWCDKTEGTPMSRNPAKRTISADDAVADVENESGNPELKAPGRGSNNSDMQSESEPPQRVDHAGKKSAREDSDRLRNRSNPRDVHIPDTAPSEEPLEVPLKSWTKIHRVLGIAAMPSERSNSGLGLRSKGSVDSLDRTLKRCSRDSSCKAKDGLRASSRASSKGTQLSELSMNEGMKKSDSKSRRMKFWKKA